MHSRFLALTLGISGLLASATWATDAVVLVEDGRPVATVYHARPILTAEELANPPRRPDNTYLAKRRWTWAVNDLVDHIQRITGATLTVVQTDDPAAIVRPAIVLDALAVRLGAGPEKSVESGDGYRILIRDGLVLLGGQPEAGDRHAIYALLKHMGCDWVMPGAIGTITPSRANLALAAMDRSDAPAILIRNLWVGGYKPQLPEEPLRYERWKQRQLGGAYEHPVAMTAGHYWDALIRNNKAEFDRHPEMLALVRDRNTGQLVRRGPQVETTHPRIKELFVEHIRKTYATNIAAGKWTRETPAGFPVGPADGFGYSISTESQLAGSGRIDPVTGEADVTDLLILLANQILAEIHPDYPNAILGCYNYSTHADYPARYQPHPNIGQIFAPINFSRFHGPGDRNITNWSYYRDVVERWAALSRKQGNPLTYRGYSWNLAENLMPFSKVRIWGEELPWYRDLGFVGLNVQAIKAWSVLAPSDYVFMRLAWNPDQDWRVLLREFCALAYGPAADQLDEYWLRQTQQQHEAGQEAGSYHAIHLIYDRQFIAQQRALLDKALAQSLTDATRERIEYVEHNLEMLVRYLNYHEATQAFDFALAERHLKSLYEHWQAAYDRNTDLVCNVGPRYLDRFLKDFAEQARRYATSPYEIVYRVPDELPTRFDPTGQGEQLNYHAPTLNDAGWLRTRTISTTWDAQGLAAVRGSVWYTVRFTPPPTIAPGQGVGLFLGGFDDEARIWINGVAVGTSGRRFSKSAVFDLTQDLLPDQENQLAIQIVNNLTDELGTGGILRPAFIFLGPRLAEKAPRQMDFGRTLPGAGEVR